MPCVDLNLELPTIPDFLLAAPALPLIEFPIGADLCCHFRVNDPGINAVIQGLNAAVAAAFAAGSAELMLVIAGLNEAILQGQYILDEIKDALPECPIDTVSV